MVFWRRFGVGALLVASAGSCLNTPSSGVVIPTADDSPPHVALSAQQLDQTVGVESGGAASGLALTQKPGLLYLVVNAADTESGVKTVEIWVNKGITTCTGALCTTKGPGLQGQPTYKSEGPAKSPGEMTAAMDLVVQSLGLTAEIPQGAGQPDTSLAVTLYISAVGVNYLGGRSRTPELTVTSYEEH